MTVHHHHHLYRQSFPPVPPEQLAQPSPGRVSLRWLHLLAVWMKNSWNRAGASRCRELEAACKLGFDESEAQNVQEEQTENQLPAKPRPPLCVRSGPPRRCGRLPCWNAAHSFPQRIMHHVRLKTAPFKVTCEISPFHIARSWRTSSQRPDLKPPVPGHRSRLLFFFRMLKSQENICELKWKTQCNLQNPLHLSWSWCLLLCAARVFEAILPGFHALRLAPSASRLRSAAALWTLLSALLHTQ